MHLCALLLLSLLNLQPAPTTQPRTVRCAVIHGMIDVQFWPALAARFEKETGIKVETVAFGEKMTIDQAFREGGIDLISLHASDKIINLVADGWAMDPQPWCRNDFILVGPSDDPAKIKGTTSAGEALRKIAESGQPLVVHASLGAQEVLRAIIASEQITFDEKNITMLFEDRQRTVLTVASKKKAYTLIGRIPFRTGKLPSSGMQIIVEGDPALRRPYVVAVANPSRVAGAHVEEARQLVRFLRDPQTQRWISEFGKGKYDDRPLFFPVEVE